jgi:hypothetical protein
MVSGGAGAPAPAPAAAAPVDTADVVRRLTPALAEIGRAAAVARQSGARFVVLLINPQLEDGSFAPVQYAYNHVVGGFCRTEGIEVVDPLPALVARGGGRPRYRAADNYHWTPAAHRVAAELVYRSLESGDAPRGP